MQRVRRSVASFVTPSSLLTTYQLQQRRWQIDHEYLRRGPKVDSAGLDFGGSHVGLQAEALHNEQWEGYSDSYLARTPNYMSRYESTHKPTSSDAFDKTLELAYFVYGEAADRLLLLQNDPLHSDFHNILAKAEKYREDLAAEIDEIYASSHPTVKTLIDAFGVRRYYFLIDWEIAVVNKRREILEKLSPEFITESIRGKQVAESYKEHLKHLGDFIGQTTALPAYIDESKFTEEEMVVLRRKIKHDRNMRQFGRSVHESDYNLR